MLLLLSKEENSWKSLLVSLDSFLPYCNALTDTEMLSLFVIHIAETKQSEQQQKKRQMHKFSEISLVTYFYFFAHHKQNIS